MGGGKNFLVSAAGLSILGNGIFWWKAKTKRLFSQCRLQSPIPIFRDTVHLKSAYTAESVAFFQRILLSLCVLGDGDKSIYSYFRNTPKLFHRRQRIYKKYLREYGEYEGLTRTVSNF
jgi:hypothetical protein